MGRLPDFLITFVLSTVPTNNTHIRHERKYNITAPIFFYLAKGHKLTSSTFET